MHPSQWGEPCIELQDIVYFGYTRIKKFDNKAYKLVKKD